jgi:hypothetical protein
MSEDGQGLRYRLRLVLPEGFESRRLESNWSDMFMGLPRETEWEVEPQSEEELEWLVADFLAAHAPVICEAAGVGDFEDVPDPGAYVDIEEL